MAEQLQLEKAVPPGLRVLIVEDMWLVAQDLSSQLEDLGCHVAGPAGRLQQAIEIAQSEALDGALLDVNLGVDKSLAIAATLQARGVPFVLPGKDGLLIGHVALANDMHRLLDEGQDVLAIFRGEDAYVSPNYYPSKPEHHRHVPT